jgi:hypothetical protein
MYDFRAMAGVTFRYVSCRGVRSALGYKGEVHDVQCVECMCMTATMVKSATTTVAKIPNADNKSPSSAINRHTMVKPILPFPRTSSRPPVARCCWPSLALCASVASQVDLRDPTTPRLLYPSTLSSNHSLRPVHRGRRLSEPNRHIPASIGSEKEIGRMALALPNDVQKVANEGVVKLFGKWDAEG